ncbi:MAG: response regulator [Eubacterium sp.]|nr:response regulator [Eubacterium sp.]
MRYKTLLIGRNNSMIDDFFNQTEDMFEVMTSSVRYEDMMRHLKYVDPDIFVYCIYNESMDVFSLMANIKEQLFQRKVPFILIGSKEDCDEFERSTANVPDLVLHKPLTAEAITLQLSNFMRGWESIKSKTKDAIQKNKTDLSAGAKAGADIQEEEPKRKHILVVDDSPIMLKTLKEHLRDDYDIATAVSGKVALKFLERRKTDLILLDYEMPEESGPAVLEKLRANPSTKDIPVIFLTGVTDSGKIREALVLKPQGYLLKPIDHDKLMDAITKVIE